MKLYRLFSGILLMLILVLGLSVAKPDLTPTTAIVGKSSHNQTVVIPKHAVEMSPGIYWLGSSVQNGLLVEGYAFVDYKKDAAKKTGCRDDGVCQGWEDSSCADCAGGGGEEPVSSCYGFLAKGAKWKTIENYLINPSNTRGLDQSFITSNFANDISKWENAAEKNIIGTGTTTSLPLSADMNSPDRRNEVYFADISQSNAIAITIVWGYFRGPPGQRELIEWDQVYDDVDFDWGVNESNKMDFESIATHELGHSVGMNDLYDTKCSEETMYGYAANGETKKRTLEAGDINGIKDLYK
jgi:hypothetical protein